MGQDGVKNTIYSLPSPFARPSQSFPVSVTIRNVQGTWTTHMSGSEGDFVKVRNDISPEMAATLRTNPATAYRMLKKFVQLLPGECLIQNGANSGVGQAAIQIAKKMGELK